LADVLITRAVLPKAEIGPSLLIEKKRKKEGRGEGGTGEKNVSGHGRRRRREGEEGGWRIKREDDEIRYSVVGKLRRKIYLFERGM
jgi:hypothetical protein